MAVTRKNSDIPDILPLMNGQDTSLLYINEDVHKIKSRVRDSNFDSVKSNKSLALYDPDTTGRLAAETELTISNETYDTSKGTEQIKTSYSDVITPRKFTLQNNGINGSTGNLAHGTQATVNGDISHISSDTQIAAVASSPQQGTVSSLAHANLNSMNGNMQEGNDRQPMLNGNASTEHVEISTGMSNDGTVTHSSESRRSSSQQVQSNRGSQNDVSTERTEVTKRSTSIKKSGSFQIRSSMNRDSYHSEEGGSKDSSIAGSADITVSTDRVNEVSPATSNQEIRRSSRASSNERPGSRPVSASSGSAPSYMRDTNSSQAKRSSRASERTPSTSSDKPPLHRSTSKTSNSGSRPPSGQFTAVRSPSQSPPPSPTKVGGASRSSSARRSRGEVHVSPSASSRNSMVASRSSSVKRGDSFSRESPPMSPTRVSATPQRTPSMRSETNSVQYPASNAAPVRTSSVRSSSVSRSSSASRESRPRKPSQDYVSPVRDSTTASVVTETSVTRSARNSMVSTASSKPPSRTPSAASKPPSGSNQVSRQSSQRRLSSPGSATPTSSRTSTKERNAGNFVMKHGPGVEGGQGVSSVNISSTETRTFQTSTPKPSTTETSESFELSAGLLNSQKAQLKTNGYSPKPRIFVDTNKSSGQEKTSKWHVNTSHTKTEMGRPSVTSPTDVIVSSPVSPMDEMRNTVQSGRVGKLIKDFKTTPLTGRLFDPSSLERNKKTESPTRKFKFAVEGIDVPLSPTSTESPASNDDATPVTHVAPGVVPVPPPISPALLSQIAANGSTTNGSTANGNTTNGSSTNTTITTTEATTTSETTATTVTTEVMSSEPDPGPTSPGIESTSPDIGPTSPDPGPTSPVPVPPPPPPPSDFSDTTPMNSLERERKRGFTYILDDKVVPEMKKRAEDVMARKPHETVEEQVQSKRTSDIIHDHEVATLREARAKLNRQEKSPGKSIPPPPDYSTLTTDNETVIKVSSDAQQSNRDSQLSGSAISSSSTQKSTTDVQRSGNYQLPTNENKRSSVEMKSKETKRSSVEVKSKENKRSSVEVKSKESKRSSVEVKSKDQIDSGGKKIQNESTQSIVNGDKQQINVDINSNQTTQKSTTQVNVSSVNVKVNEKPGQVTNVEGSATTAPPVSPVKSQRSPDSAYHSDAQSPGFELGKTLAPSFSNIETQEVTVQRAAIESTSQRGQGSAQPGLAGQSTKSEARQSLQSETPPPSTSGQSARDSGAARVSTANHLGPPQDTSSPLPASSYRYDGLLTTTSTRTNAEDIGPVTNTAKESINNSSHGTLHTEITSTNSNRQVRDSFEADRDKFSVHIQPTQGSHRITVGGSPQSPTYSSNSYSPTHDNNYSSLPRSESNYSPRHSGSSARYYTKVSPGPSPRQGRQGYTPRHHQGPSGPSSRVVPLHPVSVDVSLADRYSPRNPSNRHLQTIHGMSAMAGEVMQPFNQMSSGGGRHFDLNDGRYVAEQYNFSTYERTSGTRQLNGNGLAAPTPDMDGNSSYNYSSMSYNNNNVSPKRKYLKVDESRSNGRVPMYNGDLESYEYHQNGHNRSPRYKINSARTTDDVFEDESIHSEPGYRHNQRHVMNNSRRLQKQSAMSRSQPHLNELGQPNSFGEPLYVSVPHSPPRYGTLRSARSETMLTQQSPSGGDATLLLPHLEDAKSKTRAKYPYHITLKLNQLAGSRPGSSHMSLQRSSRDGYNGYNSLQSERNQTHSLSGIYGSHKRPMHTSSVSLVNIELDPRSPTGQQPARYREDGSYSRQEKYSYQQHQQQQQTQDAYVFNGSLPGSHVESTQVINTSIGSPQKMGEKEFFLNIDNIPESKRVNNNYVFKTSSNQTNERVSKRQNKPQPQYSGKDPDFTMAINQTMTMDYLPKKKKRDEEPRRQKVVKRYEEDIENYLSPAEDEDDRYYQEIPRVERGTYLIKNSIDTTSAPQHIDVVNTDELDASFAVEDNTNLFHNKYVTRRDNPGYVSDEEEEVYIEKKHQKPQFTNIFERVETTKEEDVVDIPVSYTTSSYETSFSKQGNADRMERRKAKKPSQRVDRTDYEERITSSSSQQRSEPRMQTTTERVEITEHDLERLLKGAPPGSVKQTINVEREEEEILGPLPITHADGEESAAADGLLNFDTVSEKVELGIVHGKAQLTVKVRCERVVPIRGVDDMFKKSSVIVTRLIEIDMEATRERRHLLDNIMSGSSKRTLNESTGHVRHSSQKTLNTKDTFQLYKTFMAMAEAEEGRDTKGEMHVEKRLEDERGLPDHAEFDIRTEDVDERVFGEPVEMEYDTDDLERRLETQMMTNGITNGTRLEAMPNGRGHVIKGQDPDTISYRSAASDNSGIIY